MQAKVKTNEVRLGYLVGWSLNHIRAPKEQIEKIAESHGLKDDFHFPRLSAVSAYRRAVSIANRAVEKDLKIYDITRIKDDPEILAHAIASTKILKKKHTDEIENDIAYTSDVRIGIDKKKVAEGHTLDAIIYSSEHPMVQRIISEYKGLVSRYTTDDVRTAFQGAFLKWHGTRILNRGGLWWIPERNANKVEAWQQFIKEINDSFGSSNITFVVPTFDNDQTRESLNTGATQSLEQRIQELKNTVESIDDKTREATLVKRISQMKELQKTIGVYKEILDLKSEGLEDSLSKINQKITEALA